MDKTLSDDALIVFGHITYGKENAILLSDLSALTGKNKRTIKKCVQEIRDAGNPVVSSSYGGYFLPRRNSDDDIAEAQRFCNMQRSQAISRFRLARSVKRWLNYLGQISMEEDYGEDYGY